MSQNSQVKIANFPGCTTQDMKDHIKPLLRRNPDKMIIHVGTNSLRSSSSLIKRSDDEALACKVQYCPKVMQAIIDEYRENRDISAIFNAN